MASSHRLLHCSYLQTEVRAFNCRTLLQRVPLFADAGTCPRTPAPSEIVNLIPKTCFNFLLRGRSYSVTREVAAIFAFGSRGSCPVRGRDCGGNVRTMRSQSTAMRADVARCFRFFISRGEVHIFMRKKLVRWGCYGHSKSGRLFLHSHMRPSAYLRRDNTLGRALFWLQRNKCVWHQCFAFKCAHPVTHPLCYNFSLALSLP